MDVKVSAKEEKSPRPPPPRGEKQVQDEYKKKLADLREQLTEALANILLGEKIPLDVVNNETGEIIIPSNRKITKTLLRKLAVSYDKIEIDPSHTEQDQQILDTFRKRFEDYRWPTTTSYSV